MLQGILWWELVHRRHLRISSPPGSRRMSPLQSSLYALWSLSLVYHLLVWPVQGTVCTWSWGQALGSRRYHCISCGSSWNSLHRKWNLCRRPWDTRHRELRQTLKRIEYIRTLVSPLFIRYLCYWNNPVLGLLIKFLLFRFFNRLKFLQPHRPLKLSRLHWTGGTTVLLSVVTYMKYEIYPKIQCILCRNILNCEIIELRKTVFLVTLPTS